MLNYEVAGEGSNVVLIHSAICDLRMWDAQWTELTSQFRVLRVDLSGYGDSPYIGEEGQDAGEVLEVLDEVGMVTATFVGSSFGGRIVQECAMLAPDRVEKLVLIGSATSGIKPTGPILDYFAEEDALIEAGKYDEASTLNVETWLGPEVDEVTRGKVWEMQRKALDNYSKNPQHRRLRVEIDLSAITAPTAIITGSHDFEFFDEIAQHLFMTLPRATWQKLEWAGHLPSLERPAEFTEILIPILMG